ncbi:MAG: ATP synthase subunit I [Desulfobacterota bacterium]|nr:ATP synthase subunit I [Thermodesulfobacteriota bacterium]
MSFLSFMAGREADPLLRKIRLMNGAVWVALLGAGLVFMPWRFTLGIAAGGMVILANFHLLARALKSGLTPGQLTTPMAVIAKYYLRLAGTALVLFFLIAYRLVDPFGLIMGLSVVVINLTLMGCNEMRKILFKEAN